MCDSRVCAPLASLKPAAVQIEIGLPQQPGGGGGGGFFVFSQRMRCRQAVGRSIHKLQSTGRVWAFQFSPYFLCVGTGEGKIRGFSIRGLTETLRFGVRLLVLD